MPKRLNHVILLASFQLILAMTCSSQHADEGTDSPVKQALVIAHRGASGYLPEHSEGAKVLAFAQGADVIEQDVVLSRDGVFVVSHDITMDHTTNVSQIFPGRQREDGHFYFADFDWSELRALAIHERSILDSRPRRFPFRTDSRILSLEDELKLILGLNRTLKKRVGFHIELKAPAWHRKQFGYRMGPRLMELLGQTEIESQRLPCFIQCFEADELLYLRKELDPQFPLVQLLGNKPLGLVRHDPGSEPLQQIMDEIPKIAGYADGIGPSLGLLLSATTKASEASGVTSTGLVELAHRHALFVHPYTVRADDLPEWCETLDDLHSVLLKQLKVDGFFTDFPDRGRSAVDALKRRGQ